MPLITFSGCNSCSLKQDWPHLHHPQIPIITPIEEGPFRVLIVGEGPGETEDVQGAVFVGKAGKFLKDFLPGDWLRKVYWGNVVRCRPTTQTRRKAENRPPTSHEIHCCSEYLERDLLLIKPHAILALGGIALSYFYGGDDIPNISKLRGIPFPLTLKDGSTTWVMGTYHPSYVMQQDRKDDEGKINNTAIPVFRADLKKFFSLLPKLCTPPKITLPDPQKPFLFPKSAEETYNLFEQLKQPFARDYETFKKRPYARDARLLTEAFSDGDLTFAYPIRWPGDPNPWGMEVFDKLARSPKRWIAQHAQFEYSWIVHHTNQPDQYFEDTEVQARLLNRRSGLGSLDVLSRIHLGVDIKEITTRALKKMMLGPLDKERILDYPLEHILNYNCIDSWAEFQIFCIQDLMLPINQKENYRKVIQSIKSTVAMELKGLHVSLDESEKLEAEFGGKVRAFEKDARSIPEVLLFEQSTHKPFSLGSNPILGEVLVNYCHIDLPQTDKENYMTGEEVLQEFAGQHPLVDLILDYREVKKLTSTYIDSILNGRLLGVDGLLHPAYTVVHTRTWRLSSEDPNIQNFPKRKHKEIRRQIVAAPGKIFAAFDYGGLEARTLCMASRDKKLKKAIIEKEDIHMRWLLRILQIYPDYIKRLADKTGETEYEKIIKAGRDIIKSDFVFACFYGSIARSVSSRTMIPLDLCKVALGEFWEEYAEAKVWIDGQFEYYNKTGTVVSLTGRVRDEQLPGNEVINTPIQGTAAEIVLEAQNALFERAMLDDINFLPRINIHDDLIFELPDDSDLERYIKAIGEEIVKPRFDWVTTPLMTECRIGYNWEALEAVTKFIGAYHESSQLSVARRHLQVNA